MAAIVDCRVTLDPVLERGDRVLAIGHFGSRLRDGGERFDFPFAILVELSERRHRAARGVLRHQAAPAVSDATGPAPGVDCGHEDA